MKGCIHAPDSLVFHFKILYTHYSVVKITCCFNSLAQAKLS